MNYNKSTKRLQSRNKNESQEGHVERWKIFPVIITIKLYLYYDYMYIT